MKCRFRGVTKASATIALLWLVMGVLNSLAMAASTDLFILSDHPATFPEFTGTQAPKFGLRLDNLFREPAPLEDPYRTTFEFQHPEAGMSLVVDDIETNDPTIHIFGKVYGGEVVGEGYGYGEGVYGIYFSYNVGVTGDLDNGWTVNTFDSSNSGIIVKIDGDSKDGLIKEGASRMFYMAQDISLNDWGPDLFKFAPDGFIPLGYNQNTVIRPTRWVGRGGLTFNSDGSASDGMQGFLFAPLPSAAWMGMAMLAGLGAVAVVRRSRQAT